MPTTKIPFAAWLVAFLCLGLNLAILLGIAGRRPDYLRDYHLSSNPDAYHYVLLGRNFLLTGSYSRCEQPPYVPDMLRTPVYPLFAGALDLLGGTSAIYLAQALLQAASCVLLFLVVRPTFGDRAALLASLFLATDLMLAVYNFGAMSEPLFVFLVLVATLCLLPGVVSLGQPSRGGLVRWLAGGLVLGLAVLTRPAGLFLPLLFVLALAVLGLWRGCWRPALGRALLLALTMVLVVGPWVLRNKAVFELPRLTTTETVNQVYFLGAGAYQVRHHVSLEEAQAMIAQEFDLPTETHVQNPWESEQSVAEMDAALTRARFQVLTKYPKELVLASVLGMLKATVSHNVAALAALLGGEWQAPGMGALLRGDATAMGRLKQNGLVLTAAFAWQLLHTGLALLAGAVGVVQMLRRPQTWPAGVVLLALAASFYLTMALFGYDAFYRCRIPVLPFLYAFAGYGLSGFLTRGRKLQLAAEVAVG
jgi:4-amino-4-deoxy-L-arabinose transferase-like glycosyltransferase